jgi:2'-5' RNA ligase
MPSVTTKRLFVAIDIPLEVKRALSACQNKLGISEADVKWTEPQNIHLTLKFLGSVSVENIARIRHSLDKQFYGQNIFDTKLNRIGAFPSLSDARILWIGLNDEKGILKGYGFKD